MQGFGERARTTIVCDIDGTIANCEHRLQYIDKKNKKKDWTKFYDLVGFDKPIDKMIKIINMMRIKMGYRVYLVTSRNQSCEEKTRAWLRKHKVKFDYLFMRKSSDNRKSSIVKTELIEPIKDRIFCIFEDDCDVVKTFREAGYLVLQPDIQKPFDFTSMKVEPKQTETMAKEEVGVMVTEQVPNP